MCRPGLRHQLGQGWRLLLCVVWEGEALKQIIHKPTTHSITPDAELHITGEFEILYNWSGVSATLARGAAKLRICDMFAKDSGPHKTKFASGTQGAQAWARLAARAQEQADYEKQEQESKLVVADSLTCLTPQEETAASHEACSRGPGFARV